MTITEVGRQEVDWMVRNCHYLHRWPGVVVLIMALIEDRVPKGCIIYALPPRETAKRFGGKTWELARLWLDDCLPKNSESWFISQSIKYIRKNFSDVVCLVSYADPSAGHTGTTYKASNWIADGRTDQGRRTPRFDYKVGEKVYSRKGHVPPDAEITRVARVSKYRFVFWMKDHESKRLDKSAVRL